MKSSSARKALTYVVFSDFWMNLALLFLITSSANDAQAHREIEALNVKLAEARGNDRRGEQDEPPVVYIDISSDGQVGVGGESLGNLGADEASVAHALEAQLASMPHGRVTLRMDARAPVAWYASLFGFGGREATFEVTERPSASIGGER